MMKSKRSRSIKLVAMGTTMLVLAACDEPVVDVAMFQTIDQCVQTEGFTKEQCEAKYGEAQAAHQKVSPKYHAAADCEADFGAEQCEESPYRTRSGSSVFMPLMVGYMMGRGLGGAAAQPLYRSADDRRNFRTADNKRVGARTGLTQVARSATRMPAAKTSTVARGGFGANARASSAG